MFDFDLDFLFMSCLMSEGALPIGQAVIGYTFIIV